jgi:Ca2+-binding EF-hand superfamily protein
MNGSLDAAKRAEELLKRYDKNGDGKLDDDERADAKEAMMKEQVDRQMARAGVLPGGLQQFRTQVLEMFDKNRDGRLDDEERTAAQKFADNYATATDDLTKQFDKNGDGKIDPAERATMEAYVAALRALGAGQMRSELLRRFDRNADGKIDESEMDELEKFVRPRMETTPAQLRRYDKNGDGKLDDTEWIEARTAIAQWLNSAAPTAPAALENGMLRDQPGPKGLRPPDEAAPRRGMPDRGGDTMTAPSEIQRTPEQESARLKAVADEVARRRASRAAATVPNSTSK